METDTVIHEPHNSRYVLMRGDQEIGEAVYKTGDRGDRTFTHTEVNEDLQEGGLGSTLARGALDHTRHSTPAPVGATCEFMSRFISDHPEYHDLTAR